jgi:hypothetical protein
LGGEHRFSYRPVRVWEIDPDEFLRAGLGTLPLALVSRISEGEVPAMVAAVRARADAELSATDRNDFWAVVAALMGLRFDATQIRTWLRGVSGMEESSFYQSVLQDGREQGREQGQVNAEQRLLLLYGTRRFGEPDAVTRASFEAIADLCRLERMHQRMLDVSSWAELLREDA